MNNYDAVLDFGSKNLRLGIFDQSLKNIYFSEKKITNSLDKSLNSIIRDAEKYLSTHIDNIIVLFDSPKFYSLDISIKKVFDHEILINKVYNKLIEEAHFIVSQNNFKDQIIHLVVNDIIVDDNKKLDKIIEGIKIKSLILEIKFICLSKILIDEISNRFKMNNLKILNLYCSSYIKASFHKKKLDDKNFFILIDIGFERTTGLIFNENKLKYLKSIPLGSNNITKDISKVLKLNLEYSEDLKIKFNRLENETSFNKTNSDKINLYSEVLKKNISIHLLKQIIEARVNEIIDLVIFSNNYINNFNSLTKPKLFLTGRGSKLLSTNYKLSIIKSVSELTIFDENDIDYCRSGLDYHKSDESLLTKIKKKEKKFGFFESFFNFFSK